MHPVERMEEELSGSRFSGELVDFGLERSCDSIQMGRIPRLRLGYILIFFVVGILLRDSRILRLELQETEGNGQHMRNSEKEKFTHICDDLVDLVLGGALLSSPRGDDDEGTCVSDHMLFVLVNRAERASSRCLHRAIGIGIRVDVEVGGEVGCAVEDSRGDYVKVEHIRELTQRAKVEGRNQSHLETRLTSKRLPSSPRVRGRYD